MPINTATVARFEASRNRLATLAYPSVESFVDAVSSVRTETLVALLTDDATGISDSAGLGLGLAEKLIQYSTPERHGRLSEQSQRRQQMSR
ncbi:hypothetical protein ACLMAJ_29050 [Nocardia sp. KC 131]|uniref:hypothetical protein n=1 Tax=Nocardia arseniciresistens TaxID=3392119 RepID=UPI00398EA875